MRNASDLLGSPAENLTLAETGAAKLGLPPGTTYQTAFSHIQASGTTGQGRAFVAAVIALKRDERVQGHDLNDDPITVERKSESEGAKEPTPKLPERS